MSRKKYKKNSFIFFIFYMFPHIVESFHLVLYLERVNQKFSDEDKNLFSVMKDRFFWL